jgi:hypothetical protein
MARTHYLHVIGEGPHTRGSAMRLSPPSNVSPGYVYHHANFLLNGGTTPPPLNAIVRGATSQASGRIVRIGSAGSYILELIGSIIGENTPGGAFAVTSPFVGEAVSFDSGGGAIPSPFADGQFLPGLLDNFVTQIGDAEHNTFTPEDPSTDYVLFDRQAKVCSELVLTIASVSPALPTVSFIKGDRCTTSSGGAFTIQLITVVGSDYRFKITRRTGTIGATDVITNTTGARAGATATLTSAEADLPRGTFVAHHLLPNVAGLGTYYEQMPWGDAMGGNGGIGVLGPITRGFWKKQAAAYDPDDRGARVVPVNTLDEYLELTCTGTFPGTWTLGETVTSTEGWSGKLVSFDATLKEMTFEACNGAVLHGGVLTGASSGSVATFSVQGVSTGLQQFIMGGVTIQVLRCSGTFPTTWTPGETVNAVVGSWSGIVQGWHASRKLLFVRDVNGETLQSGGVVGATSGATATNYGAAYGWQKGSRHWSYMVAEIAAAKTRANALYHGQAAIDDGAVLMIWESELSVFAPAGMGCPWVQQEDLRRHWVQLIDSLRTEFANPDLPLAIFQMDVRSHLTDVGISGLPFAYFLRGAMDDVVRSRSHVALINTDGSQGFQITQLPYSSNILFLRPQDYWEIGKRAWRALEFAQWSVPAGTNLEELPVIGLFGFSFMNGGIGAGWGFGDVDPDLYPSVGFPGVNTLDGNCLMWSVPAHELLTYDIANNTGGFKGSVGFGLEAPLFLRAKRRFAKPPEQWQRVAVLKLAYGGTTANGKVLGTPATWDPDGAEVMQVTANMSVTAIPADSNNPARGRFTAAAGTFTMWTVGAHAAVSGSALGNIGFGGNETTAWAQGIYVRAVAADGSYVDIEGPFVNEATRSFTLVHGAYALKSDVETEVRLFFADCIAKGFYPRVVGIGLALGEVDLERDVSEYKAAMLRICGWLREILGQRLKNEAEAPVVLYETTPNTPWNATDEKIAALITAQREVAAEIGNATSIDTSRLPMESAGIWPRTMRQHNGVHTTPRGYMMLGYEFDRRFELLGWPEHPDGDAAIDFGSSGGGVSGSDRGTEDDSESTDTRSIGDGGSGGPLSEGDARSVIDNIDAALLASADVAAYTVNGRTVQKQSIAALLEARKYYEAQAARARGLRRTKVAFR